YPIGEIVAVEGTAHSISQNGQKKLQPGDPVYFNAKIETGAESRALILFIDDTQIMIGGNARLEIDEFVFDPYDPAENEAEFSFLKGPFLWASGLIARKDEPDVQLRTPHGSIGIRGTTVWGGTLDQGFGVFVAEGLVNFSGNWGSADIPAGKGVFLGQNNQPGETKPWAEQTVNTALKTITFRNKDAATLERQLKILKKGNMQKRHDYRARMFPFKENPYRKKLKIEEDDFFTDEFNEMRGRQ
ncbi:MAG: FecR domain-containing protein, partial [Alphaproteobacteria bacterium]